MKQLKQLTKNEIGYLEIAYEKGYRYVATDKNDYTYFYVEKPKKGNEYWCQAGGTTSLTSFNTSWDDVEPISIAGLLGIDDVDWSKVKPFTFVWVHDKGKEHWHRANFIAYDPSNATYPFKVTMDSTWSYSGGTTTWNQCKLATQEEIKERAAVLIK